MATTPNYGWVTPAPTDFVTDLPADFETFADAVDADLAGLLGGTTGQVLTKDSATDHDFSWATISAGGLTLLSTTSLSGTSTDISTISQDYVNLLVIATDITLSTGGVLRFRPNAGAMTIGAISGGSASQLLNGEVSTGSETSFPNYAFTIYDYTTAKAHSVIYAGNRAATSMFGGGLTNDTSAVTSIRFTTSAGTATFTAGSVKIYGVK